MRPVGANIPAYTGQTMTKLPLPSWRRINGVWHVEVVLGARKSRCGQAINPKAPSSAKSMPTHCDPCLKHWRLLRKGGAR